MARRSISTGDSFAWGWGGPFVDGNNNVWAIIYDVGTATLRAHRPTGDGDPIDNVWGTWDSANEPAATATYSCWQEGDTIHLVHWDSGNEQYEWSEFNTSDHSTNANKWGTTEQLIESPTNAPLTAAAYIAVRSDGDRIVLYNGDTDKVMGTDYDRCDYARWEGSSWTVAVNVHGDSLESNANARSIGRGASDEIFFEYNDNVTNIGTHYFKRLSSANSLSSGTQLYGEATLSQGGARNSDIIPYYDDSGVEVMSFHSNTLDKSHQTRDDTLQTALVLSGTDFSYPSHPCLAVDGTDLYCAYRSGTDDDIKYQKSSDGGAWGSITTISTATNPNSLSANVIDYGSGKYLAVVYDDGDVYYDEISIAAAPAARLSKLTLLGVG